MPNKELKISFKHVSYEFPKHLECMISPHFSEAEAKNSLRKNFLESENVTQEECGIIELEEKLILFANEAFPEAAINDPLGDLRVWDLWRTGIRSFPYPGHYSPLNIHEQEPKVASTSSTGVIGECLSGLFATAGIAPWPTVRVIGRWPDFIFYDQTKKQFAFLESKASIQLDESPENSFNDHGNKLLGDFLFDALKQLLADRTVSVWGGFTVIKSIEPFKANVTFVETSLVQNSEPSPESTVFYFLSELILQIALSNILKKHPKTKYEEDLFFKDDNLSPEMSKEIHHALSQLPKSIRPLDNITLIEEIIFNILKKKKKKILSIMKKHSDPTKKKLELSTSIYKPIRRVTGMELMGKILSVSEADNIDDNWHQRTRDWHSVGKPFGFDHEDGEPIFRFGGLLIKAKREK